MDEDLNNTLEIILACISDSTEFPALAETIGLINTLTSKDETTVTELANTILKDLSLTSKILKLVNSVLYRQCGEITTISRAVMILGYKNVRNIALGLALFKQLTTENRSRDLLELLIKALFSGLLAREMATQIDSIDAEEAFICTLFRSLGEIMVSFYLPDRFEAVKTIAQGEGLGDDEAAVKVLGASYDVIGRGIAQAWHFPEKIVESMVKVRGPELKGKPTEMDRLRALSTMAKDITGILSSDIDDDEKKRRIDLLASGYREHIGSPGQKTKELVASALTEIKGQSSVFDLNLKGSLFIRGLSGWTAVSPPTEVQKEETKVPTLSAEALMAFDSIDGEAEENPETIFTKGIQEVSNALLADYSLDDVLRIVLETIHRGFRFSGESKTLLFIRDRTNPTMNFRFGLGEALQEVRKWFTIPLGESQDIFNIALSQHRDLIIKDSDVPDVRLMLPEWYLRHVPPGLYLVVLPLVINNKPIGLLYTDGPKEGLASLPRQCLNHLKILRDQSILAIRQKT